MERFTISLSDSLATDFDHWLQARGYINRSEGVRELLRKEIANDRSSKNQAVNGYQPYLIFITIMNVPWRSV